MRNTFSVSFYCRTSKVGKKGVAPIEMGISCNGTRLFINLPMKVDPEEFNRKRKPQYIVTFCDNIKAKVNSYISDMILNDIPITSATLRECVRNGGVKSFTVGDMIDGFLSIKRKEMYGGRITIEHFKKLEYARDFLLQYVKREQEVTVITPALVQNIYADLRAKYKDQTSAGYMTKVKAIIKFAIDNGKLAINPLSAVKIEKGKNEIEMLSDGDFNRIVQKEIKCDRIAKVRDLFVFACGSGLAYADLKDVEPKDFREMNGRLCIIKPRNKTGNTFVSVLLPFAVDIAKKYDYNLKDIILSNQKMNSYLTEIQDICGVTSVKSLHSHLGRHYYCNKLLNLGIRPEVVARAAGHSNYKTLMKYYARVEDKTTVDEIAGKI